MKKENVMENLKNRFQNIYRYYEENKWIDEGDKVDISTLKVKDVSIESKSIGTTIDKYIVMTATFEIEGKTGMLDFLVSEYDEDYIETVPCGLYDVSYNDNAGVYMDVSIRNWHPQAIESENMVFFELFNTMGGIRYGKELESLIPMIFSYFKWHSRVKTMAFSDEYATLLEGMTFDSIHDLETSQPYIVLKKGETELKLYIEQALLVQSLSQLKF